MKQIKYVIILLFVLLTFSCSKKSKGKEKFANATQIIIPDSIQNFQHKRNKNWIVVRTTNQKRIAELIGLETYENSNWEHGLNISHWGINYVYISPIVNDELIFIVGRKGPFYPNSKRLRDLLIKLSVEFGEVNYYYTYSRHITSHRNNNDISACIAKYVNGELIRYVYYLYEGWSFSEEGERTKAEEKVGLKRKVEIIKYDSILTHLYRKRPKEFKRRTKNKEYSKSTYDSVDKIYVYDTIPWIAPNFVYEIANEWGINPLTMNNGINYSNGLGLLGKVPE
jgi:hypothetical protein